MTRNDADAIGYLLREMPPGHQKYVFSQLLAACSRGRSEEDGRVICSEVLAKVLVTPGADDLLEGADSYPSEMPVALAVNTIPERDERVQFVLRHLTKRSNINQRAVDDARSKWGRAPQNESGYFRLVQIGALAAADDLGLKDATDEDVMTKESLKSDALAVETLRPTTDGTTLQSLEKTEQFEAVQTLLTLAKSGELRLKPRTALAFFACIKHPEGRYLLERDSSRRFPNQELANLLQQETNDPSWTAREIEQHRTNLKNATISYFQREYQVSDPETIVAILVKLYRALQKAASQASSLGAPSHAKH